MDDKTTRRKLILASLAALATNTFVAPSSSAKILDRLTYPHSKADAQGKYTVMLDPGHGGIDSGAVGPEGTLEKHVVLDIANKVKTILKRHGVNALLTRSDDTFIPLYHRIQIAHAHNASLFMSIHADGFASPAAHGASVYALSTQGASSAMAKYLSKSENEADDIVGNSLVYKDKYLNKTIFDLKQTETIRESLLLGAHIVQHIAPVHHMHSSQTEQAAFVVLKSPYIPSVLVETSFITNPEEEKLLGTAAFRYKISCAISSGIINYFKSY